MCLLAPGGVVLNQSCTYVSHNRTPDRFLNAAAPSAAETIGKVIIAADAVLAASRPDALFLLGGANGCLVIIAAKRQKIPIFHMDAGNRCFDMRVPEEINRRIIDHTADISLTYSDAHSHASLPVTYST